MHTPRTAEHSCVLHIQKKVCILKQVTRNSCSSFENLLWNSFKLRKVSSRKTASRDKHGITYRRSTNTQIGASVVQVTFITGRDACLIQLQVHHPRIKQKYGLIYRGFRKSVKHFKNSQQINYSTIHGSSYADRDRNSPSFFFTYFTDAQCVRIW